MNKLKTIIVGLLALPVLGLSFTLLTPAATVSAVATENVRCNSTNVSIQKGAACAKSTDQEGSITDVIETVTNVLLFVVGAVSVIMLIIGGIRYTTSNGDSSQITAAKNTIMYGVIGLIVALLAFAIVGFVIDSFTASSGSRGSGATSMIHSATS